MSFRCQSLNIEVRLNFWCSSFKIQRLTLELEHLKGEVTVETPHEKVSVGKGDLVTFPIPTS